LQLLHYLLHSQCKLLFIYFHKLCFALCILPVTISIIYSVIASIKSIKSRMHRLMQRLGCTPYRKNSVIASCSCLCNGNRSNPTCQKHCSLMLNAWPKNCNDLTLYTMFCSYILIILQTIYAEFWGSHHSDITVTSCLKLWRTVIGC
jgi:hypothetical protein